MGFLSLTLLGLAAAGAMALLGVPRLLWSTMGAALFLGAIGYAWQGRPLLPSAAAQARSTMAPFDPAAVALRDSLLGRYTADTTYLVAADAMMRAGDDDAAVRVVLGGLSRYPRSFALWTWAGVTMTAAAGDRMSPPVLLAFRQAARLAPEHPAPPFYQGLAYVQAGQFPEARRAWHRALSLSPLGTDYRRKIAARVALLDMLLARRGGAGEAPPR